MPTPKGADPRILDHPGRGITPARLLAMLLLGAATALPLGSAPLAAWSSRLPDACAPLQDAAQAWDGWMQQAGLGAPYAAIHRLVNGWTAPPP